MRAFSIFTLAAILALAVATNAQTISGPQSDQIQEQAQVEDSTAAVAAPAPEVVVDEPAPATAVAANDTNAPSPETLQKMFPDQYYY